MNKKKPFVGVLVGKYEIVLIDARKVMGHDDSLPYNAEFEIRDNFGKCLAKGNVWNDGWGGISNFSITKDNEINGMQYDMQMELLPKVNKVCKDVLKYNDTINGTSFQMECGLDCVFDFLADLMIFGSKKNYNKIFGCKAFIKYLQGA